MATWTDRGEWRFSAKEKATREAQSKVRAPQPVALHVEAGPRAGSLVVYADDEVDLCFFPATLSAFAGLSPSHWAEVTVSPDGLQLRWPSLGWRMAFPLLVAHGPEAALQRESSTTPPQAEPAAEATPPAQAPSQTVPPAAPRRQEEGLANPPPPSPASVQAYPLALQARGLVVVHLHWLPRRPGDWKQEGEWFLWGEHQGAKGQAKNLSTVALMRWWLRQAEGEAPAWLKWSTTECRLLALPTSPQGAPLPSWAKPPGEAKPVWGLQSWSVQGVVLGQDMAEVWALTQLLAPEATGPSLPFWARVLATVDAAIQSQAYLPALRHGPDMPPHQALPTWAYLDPSLDAELKALAQAMPWSLRLQAQADGGVSAWEGEALLQNLAAQALHHRITGRRWPWQVVAPVEGTWLERALSNGFLTTTKVPPKQLGLWQAWWRRLEHSRRHAPFHLALRLHEAPPGKQEPWLLVPELEGRAAPHWQAPWAWWQGECSHEELALMAQFGPEAPSEAATQWARLARLWPPLGDVAAEEAPFGVKLSLAQATQLILEEAPRLAAAGFPVHLPAWCLPERAQRPRVRLSDAQGGPSGLAGEGSGQNWLQFDVQLALGDRQLDPAAWESLVAASGPLIHLDGQWVRVDRQAVQRVGQLLAKAQGQGGRYHLTSLLQLDPEAPDSDWALEGKALELLHRLRHPGPLPTHLLPTRLQGQLRDYQSRGLAWLTLLEQVGTNGCLADDMGLGKTIQVLALLLLEREGERTPGPTLLVAPTSVLGNWAQEAKRFAPSLRVRLHHGPRRWEAGPVAEWAPQCDLVLTSYPLLWRDAEALQAQDWRRLVLDEAQQIKNPAAKQSQALHAFRAQSRLALTGTPVENRLMDLWAIFHFLNPGHLGSAPAFRENFEKPIQRHQDPQQAALLRRLTAPLILRRLKSDPRIAASLPPRVDQQHLLGLSKEQAKLYAAVVAKAKGQLKGLEGIARHGAMLATLTQLKQICNHPALALKDDSPFSVARSPKMAALLALAQEALAAGESLLVFTQYASFGPPLVAALQSACEAPVAFLHGGTPRAARDAMVQGFQAPEAPPGVMVLSLKAGGVGLNLTRASRVVHVDRWWNPAVEQQATDRAHRIGQNKTVFVHRFITQGTLEERIDALLASKAELAKQVVASDESWLQALDDAGFQALIALDHERATQLEGQA